jgi:hypothetical protein
MSVCLIDTSVFCNIVDVPGRNQQRHVVLAQLKVLAKEKTALLLPIVVILETGNHIGQLADGEQRHQVAKRFIEQVEAALDGEAPWKPTPFVEGAELRTWLEEFPNCASQGLGLGDLTIIKEWERQCQLNPARQVYVWSFDIHLSAYGREPNGT